MYEEPLLPLPLEALPAPTQTLLHLHEHRRAHQSMCVHQWGRVPREPGRLGPRQGKLSSHQNKVLSEAQQVATRTTVGKSYCSQPSRSDRMLALTMLVSSATSRNAAAPGSSLSSIPPVTGWNQD